MEMEYLRWILLGAAIILVVAVYFFSRVRSKKDQYNSPLNTSNDIPSFTAEKDTENEWMHGVGPVRVVSSEPDEPATQLTQNEAKFSATETDDINTGLETETETVTDTDTQYEPLELVKNKPENVKLVDKPPEEDALEEPLKNEPLSIETSVDETSESEPEVEKVNSKPENTDVAIDDVISVYVLAQPGEVIKGEKILSASYALHMDFGAMKIFHRHDQDEERKIQFSMANIKQPGWFEIDHMNELETPGVSFFMQVNLVDKPSAILDEMMITAHGLSSMIGATLCGAQRKPLDEAQTNELREKVKRLETLKSQSV